MKNNTKAETASAEFLPDKPVSKLNRFKKFADENGYIACSFIIAFAIMWMIYIAMRVFPFGANSVLVLDLNGQYVSFFEALRKAVYGDASLIYSFSRTLGGEFVGIYAYYIASPLSYIVALFPAENITEALLVIQLLKCGLAAGTMAWYLKKTRPFANEMASIACSCMYALSSYAVVMAHNTMWIDALIWLPLVVYGIEELIKKHRFVLFVVSLTLTLVSNYYIGYMVCIFVFIYFFYYYFSGSNNDNNYYGESFHFIKSLMRIAVASITSILSSAIMLIPAYYSLSFGKTTFSTVKWLDEFAPRFNFMQLFSKLFIGAYDTVEPTGLPFIYCGTLVLILVPLYFVAKKVSLREKIGSLSLLLILVLSMNLSALDIIWHGFQKPNWLNYRYSFILIFVAIVLAHRALEEIESIRIPYLGASVIGVAALLIIVQFAGYEYVDTFYCVWLTIILLVIYTALLVPIIKNRLKPILMTALAVIVCVETFAAGIINTYSLDEDVVFTPRDTSPQSGIEGYQTYITRTRALTDKIQAADKSFYRMENSDVRKVCDNFALGMRGISSSTSTLNAKAIKFANRMGYISLSHWSQYAGGNPVSDSLLGVKYTLSLNQNTSPYLDFYDSSTYTAYDGNVKTLNAYLNDYALSIAYAANADISEFNISPYTTPAQMMNELITTILGDESTTEVFKKIPYTFSWDKELLNFKNQTYIENMFDKNDELILDDDGNPEKESVSYYTFSKKDTSVAEAKVYLTFTVPEDIDAESIKIYSFLPTSYARESRWEIEGKNGYYAENTKTYFQDIGDLTPGKEYTLTLTVKSDALYIDSLAPMFVYIDDAAYKDAMQRLSDGNLNITSFTESSFKGTVNATDGKTTMFTTIPYDKGWNVYVDGEKVDTFMTCAALLAFDLGGEGEHTIEMTYWPSEYTLAIALTVIGAAMFAAFIVLDIKVLKPKRLKKRAELEKELEKYSN